MKKINFCKATTIILIINVILSIVLFFVVPDKIAIQWVGTSPSNAVDSYYVFLVPVLSVLFAFTGKPIFTMFLFATVYKGNIIKNLIMDCQSYTKYRPNETTGGIFVSWRRKEELPTGA